MADSRENNKFVKWFVETWERFFGPSPPYFKVIQIITVATTFIASIPDMMKFFDIQLPELWVPYYRRVIQFSAALAFLISKLPVKNATSTVTDNRTGEKEVTVNKNLPYTEAVEVTKANADPGPVVVKTSDPNVE